MRRWQRNEDWRWAGMCWAMTTLGCAAARGAATPPVPSQAVTPDGSEGQSKLVSGQLLSRYRGRFKEGESDHDLESTVDLALQDPEHRWSGAVLARAAYDLDGHESGQDDFFSLQDTYDHRLTAQLFHAYVDVASRSLGLLRVGRQPSYETPVTVFFDGVRAELAPQGERRATAGAYAGIGEHLYESSSQGDFVFGTFGSVLVWPGAELRADWMHLEDERLGAGHEDDLLGLVLGQDILGKDRATRLDLRFTSLEGNGRDVRLTGSHVESDASFSLQGSFYRLLQTQNQLAAPLDPFSDTLFELFPYTQVGLSATKDWKAFSLLSGLDLRRVDDADDEGQFNRDFERYYLTGTLPEALPVVVSLTGEVWRATDADYDTWGASLSRGFDGGWDVSVGSQYSLYEYDLVTGEERDHVRTTYLDTRWKASLAHSWRLRYSFERNDIDDYHELWLVYAWNF